MNLNNNLTSEVSSPTCNSKKNNFANRKKLVKKLSVIRKTPTKFDPYLNMEIEEALNGEVFQTENIFNRIDIFETDGLENAYNDINVKIMEHFTIKNDDQLDANLENTEDSTKSGTSKNTPHSNNDCCSIPLKRNMLKKRYESLNVNTNNKRHRDLEIFESPEWFGYKRNTVSPKTRSPLLKGKKKYINSPILSRKRSLDSPLLKNINRKAPINTKDFNL